MSKQTATNTWTDGLNKDLNPIITPNTILTDNLNGTFITYNGNEFSLQNDMGNVQVGNLPRVNSGKNIGFDPIGVKEYGGIMYIVSVSPASVYRYTANMYRLTEEELDDSSDDSSDDDENIFNTRPGFHKVPSLEAITGISRITPYVRIEIMLYERIHAVYPEFTKENAHDMLYGGVNLEVPSPGPSSHVWNDIRDILDDLVEDKYLKSYDIEQIKGANKFQIGSYPSLDPNYGDSDDEEVEQPFENVYRPLHNLIKYYEEDGEGYYEVSDFTTLNLATYDKQHPVSLEIQPSYDGSVNIILNDNKNLPRLINSGFAVLPNGNGKFVKRNQNVKTNHYYDDSVESETRLIKTSSSLTTIELGSWSDGSKGYINGVSNGGQLKSGNYTFYLKFGDEDENKTDIIAESGIISIFKGTPGDPKTVSGGLYNEITDKKILLTFTNLDLSYSKLFLYYTREYCDENGYRLVEAKSITNGFSIRTETQSILISGIEETTDISIEDLNIGYYSILSAKTSAQQQNMLFLGNLEENSINDELKQLSYEMIVGCEQNRNICGFDPKTYNSDYGGYTNPQNIYYSLGYWPKELYRFGIVYIRKDGSTTPVFNLKGCILWGTYDNNYRTEGNPYEVHNIDITDTNDNIFLNNNHSYDNLIGVFRLGFDTLRLFDDGAPLGFTFKFDIDTVNKLNNLGITGYFIVRQKRIPITICQGISAAINKESFTPMLCYSNDEEHYYFYSERFLTADKRLIYEPNPQYVWSNDQAEYYYTISIMVIPLFAPQVWFRANIYGASESNLDYCYRRTDWHLYSKQKAIDEAQAYASSKGWGTLQEQIYGYNAKKAGSRTSWNNSKDITISSTDHSCYQDYSFGIISLEANIDPEIQSYLCGTKYYFDVSNWFDLVKYGQSFYPNEQYSAAYSSSNFEGKATFIPDGTTLKYIDGKGYSNRCGDGINVDQFSFFNPRTTGTTDKYDKNNVNLIRGEFTPYIGVNIISDLEQYPFSSFGQTATINIKKPIDNWKLEYISRGDDNSPFYAVSNRLELGTPIEVYRGDCYINLVTVRMHRNFIDAIAPAANAIVDINSWATYYKGYHSSDTNWNKINITDLNTVSLGHWVTFKCLSSSNLMLRSEDTSHLTEMKELGNSRSFHPLREMSNTTGMKMADSTLYNHGYSATVGRRRYDLMANVPYSKDEFSTRVAFSNVSVTDSFMNGYRIFQGVSYQDYTKQYGSITKLLPYGNNLFCVFEHGIAIIPVNEKALIQTTTEQTIHIYGNDVLSDQLSVISQDFGSIWADSIIRTPIGIYGVDTFAKKIWRYSDSKGLETLSDMKIQRFLNDNIKLGFVSKEDLDLTNVKTHYNSYKGDLMFTLYHTYKDSENETHSYSWNLCYNERMGLWVTRYSWVPKFSENVDNTFYTFTYNKSVRTPHGERRWDPAKIWKHGKTGGDNEFRPTKWFGIQHPFEFEFVVNSPAGLHKIFENLTITSNNVQPYEIEFQIVGDDYMFNRARIYHEVTDGTSKEENIYKNEGHDKPYEISTDSFTKDDFATNDFSKMFYNARVEYDDVLDEYYLIITQKCKNKESYGIRLGNIQYKEDGWYLNIEPLRYNPQLNNQDADLSTLNDDPNKFASAKIRDKWIKIRLKYEGDRLAVVSGVTTFENISYA